MNKAILICKTVCDFSESLEHQLPTVSTNHIETLPGCTVHFGLFKVWIISAPVLPKILLFCRSINHLGLKVHRPFQKEIVDPLSIISQLWNHLVVQSHFEIEAQSMM